MKRRGTIIKTKVDFTEELKEIVLSTFGVILTALGLVIFLIPNNIAAGGASGLSIILNKVFPTVSVGIWLYVLNTILFILGFLIIGKDFSFKTIYSTFALNFFIDFFDRIIKIPRYLGEDYMLAVMFGNMLTAFGMAIVFANNSSTGGTDIIAKIITRFTHAPIGTTLLLVDFSVGILAGFTFDVRTGMYSLLAIIINGITIDFVMKGLELSVTLTIISQRVEDIRHFIIEELER